MPRIGAVKSCFAPTHHKRESLQDFAAYLVKQLPCSNVKQLWSIPTQALGKFLDDLETEDLLKDTNIVLVADHGMTSDEDKALDIHYFKQCFVFYIYYFQPLPMLRPCPQPIYNIDEGMQQQPVLRTQF
jgi:phosphoglycerol transferase MdoB-like AlkP superfamily enzyme